LVIVAIAMLALLGVAALTIDVGSWYVKRHQAQVAADAAALAAANCLATGACTSTAANGDAAQVATTISQANGVSLPTGAVSFSGNTVTVKASTSAPAYFAIHIGGTTPSASATATWTPATTPCSSPGSGCAAVFAMSQTCTPAGSSPIVLNGAGDTITGTVQSNGSIDEVGRNEALGSTTFGNGSGCTITTGGTGDTWGGSSTQPTIGQAPALAWPDDYTQAVTSCGSGYAYACTGPSGTPSYCTQAAQTFTFGSGQTTLTPGQVWCAYGASGTPSKPATWNGLIYFQSTTVTVTGNWFGGTIELGHAENLSPYLPTPTFPVMYATGSGDCTSASIGGVCMSAANQNITGAIFAPNGTIEFNGASSTTDDFLEAQDIDFVGGSVTGDGPTTVTGGTGTPGSDSLTN
jgi:Flp pilus assembly protein TadG